MFNAPAVTFMDQFLNPIRDNAAREMQNAMNGSEFRHFLDTIKRLGIPHQVHISHNDRTWQPLINQAGHNFTCLATCVVVMSGIEYLFLSDGGVFIMSRDAAGKIEYSGGNDNPNRRIIYYTNADQFYDDLIKIDPRAR